MALVKGISVYRRKGSPFWYVAFPDPKKDGARGCLATEFRADAPQSKRRAWNFAREKAGDGVVHKGDGFGWVEPWLRLRYRTQKKSLANSLNWWSWLQLYFDELGLRSPRGLTREIAVGYIEWRTAQRKRSGKLPSYNSALQELKFLSRVLREARMRDPMVVNVCERLGLRKERPPEKPEMSDAEITAIRAKLHEREGHLPLPERWMTIMFEIALHQGCREAETVAPLEHYDLKAGTVKFHVKGDRWGTVPLHPDLVPLIRSLKEARGGVTCRPPKMFTREWSRFFKGRDERGQKGFLEHLTFHCTRVTVITRLVRAGIPEQMTRNYVLHADELIHRLYQRLRPQDVRVCHSALRYPPRVPGANDAPQSGDAARATA